MISFFPAFGINFLFWSVVGFLRLIFERLRLGSVVFGTIAGSMFFHGGVYLTESIYMLSDPHGTGLPFDDITVILTILVFWIVGGLIVTYIYVAFAPKVSRVDAVLVYFIYVYISIIFHVGIASTGSENMVIITLIALGGIGVVIGFFLGINARKYWQRNLYYSTIFETNKIEPIVTEDVAAIIAAHNEELSIETTIRALQKNLPSENIYIGSDASTDKTVEIAKSMGVTVLEINPNKGKAKVLTQLIDTFDIYNRYRAVLILDAEVVVDKNFLKNALPLFDRSIVAAIIGHAVSRWYPHWFPVSSMFVTAYRIRLWRILQYTIRYGQTWKYFNVSTIVPGGSSLYRTSVLKQLTIDKPGLVIEDFNMTFEVHRKRLGEIAFEPRAFVVDQEPYSVQDYIKQIKRWYLGFWQTVLLHGFWPSAFWFSMALFSMELIIAGTLYIFLPLWLFVFSLYHFGIVASVPPLFASVESSTLLGLIVGLFLIDYLITLLITFIERKPVLALYGFGFFFLHFIDAFVYLITLPLALVRKGDGKWLSPSRRAV